jgi:hypothetical protein
MKPEAARFSWLGWLLLAALAGCASPGGSDRVEIKNLKGGRHAPTGLTLVVVTVDYTLASTPEGEIALGFDLRESGHYRMVARQRVVRGRGTVELFAKIDPLGQRALTAYVNLSEHPHPQRWQPLTSAQQPFALPSEADAPVR